MPIEATQDPRKKDASSWTRLLSKRETHNTRRLSSVSSSRADLPVYLLSVNLTPLQECVKISFNLITGCPKELWTQLNGVSVLFLTAKHAKTANKKGSVRYSVWPN